MRLKKLILKMESFLKRDQLLNQSPMVQRWVLVHHVVHLTRTSQWKDQQVGILSRNNLQGKRRKFNQGLFATEMVVIASNGTVDIGWLMYRVLEELTASKTEFVNFVYRSAGLLSQLSRSWLNCIVGCLWNNQLTHGVDCGTSNHGVLPSHSQDILA